MRKSFLAPLIVLLLILPGSAGGADETGQSAINVMSFNIRYGTADDGENAWIHRKGAVVMVIIQEVPDLIGIQEGLRFQLDYIKEELGDDLGGYGEIGVGRAVAP